MKQEVFFEYIGDREIGYVKNHEYSLVIVHRTLSQRLWGLQHGWPFNWQTIILKPIPFAYKNLNDFHSEWKYKFMRFSDD